MITDDDEKEIRSKRKRCDKKREGDKGDDGQREREREREYNCKKKVLSLFLFSILWSFPLFSLSLLL